jgi:hypothetical protein
MGPTKTLSYTTHLSRAKNGWCYERLTSAVDTTATSCKRRPANLRNTMALVRQNTLVSRPAVAHCSAALSARSTCDTPAPSASGPPSATMALPSASGKAIRLNACNAPSPSSARARNILRRSSRTRESSAGESASSSAARAHCAAQPEGSASHNASAPRRSPRATRCASAPANRGASTAARKLSSAQRHSATAHEQSPSNTLGHAATLTADAQNGSACTERTTSRTKLVRRSNTS